MERKVIAVRNKSAMIMNFVFAGIGIVALAVLIWLTTTSDDASYISLGVFACAVALGMALWYGIPAALMLGAPEELIVKQGENFIINGCADNVENGENAGGPLTSRRASC